MSGGLADSREIPNSRATGSPRFCGRRARFFLLGLVEYVENFGVPERRCHFDHVVATVFVRLAALIFLCDGVGTLPLKSRRPQVGSDSHKSKWLPINAVLGNK
jgi:hypothetical protein